MDERKNFQIMREGIPVPLEAIEDLLYKIALEMNELKGRPLTEKRSLLNKKQKIAEELQYRIFLIT